MSKAKENKPQDGIYASKPAAAADKVGGRLGPASACILAAGLSTRMQGNPKALARLAGRTLLERTATALRLGGIQEIMVITGHEAGRVELKIEVLNRRGLLGLRPIHNPEYTKGMFNSVQCGLSMALRLAERQAASGPLLITPVDAALLRPETIKALLHFFYAEAAAQASAIAGLNQKATTSAGPISKPVSTWPPICLPSFLGRIGHPLLLPAQHLVPALNWQGENGLWGYLASLLPKRLRAAALDGSLDERGRPFGLTILPLPDAGIVSDLDDLKALRQGERYLSATINQSLPSMHEACHLLLRAKIRQAKFRHSIMVALGALRLGLALRHALPCDNYLLHVSAGLLHDVLRNQPRHAEAAALLLRDLGWIRCGLVAGRHQQLAPACFTALKLPKPVQEPSQEVNLDVLPYPEEPDSALLSATIAVHMADKYCQDDKLVPLELRFARGEAQCRGNPQALLAVRERLELAQRLEQRLQDLCGNPPLELLARPSEHPLEKPLLALLKKKGL